MAIATTNNKVIYQLDGTTTQFSFDFPVLNETDLHVYYYDDSGNETELVLNTDYTITFNDDYTGSITLNNTYSSGSLLLYREVLLTQETKYVEGGPFPAKEHEKALDKLTMQTQQLNEKVERALLKDILKGEIDFGGAVIKGVGTPVENGDAVNKEYADNVINVAQQYADKAQSSANDAQNYEQETLNHLNEFKGEYYGAYDNPPTTDPNGNPIDEGDVYYDTTKKQLYWWNGSAWVISPTDAQTVKTVDVFSLLTVTSTNGTATIDWRQSSNATITLVEDTTINFINPNYPSHLQIIIKQDSNGGHVLTLPTIKWVNGVSPTLSTAANNISVISLYWDGTNYLGMSSDNFA